MLDPEVGVVSVRTSTVALVGELAPKLDSLEVLAPKGGPVGVPVPDEGVLASEVSPVAVLLPEVAASKSGSLVVLASEVSPIGELAAMIVVATLAREGGEEVTPEPAEAAETGGKVPLGVKLSGVLSDVI